MKKFLPRNLLGKVKRSEFLRLTLVMTLEQVSESIILLPLLLILDVAYISEGFGFLQIVLIRIFFPGGLCCC